VARAELESSAVDLTQLARDTLEALHQRDPQRKVDARVDEGLVARGDRRLLRIVLENLVGNAWKFTSKTEAARIEIGRDAEGAFFVRDNGVGFDAAYAGKLFNAFQRLHKESEFPGTGIGLATVRRVMARHRGRVWAESQPGHGAVFRFSVADDDRED
jgi:light-regulated signal transduction histidine kinase (bacteriophytochrome)